MKLTIDHTTRYEYDEEVQRSLQYVRLFPHENNRQKIIDWQLTLPGNSYEAKDPYGNILYVVSVDRPHRELVIRASGSVEITADEVKPDDINPLYFLRSTRLTRPNTAIREFVDQQDLSKRLNRSALIELMHALRDRMTYVVGSTQVDETAAEAFDKGQGVCQDFVHIFLACCRYLGVPARYVSGYTYNWDRENLSSHAWVQAWVKNGWHTFDVADGLTSPDRHLKLAIGLDYLEACPVRGVRWGGEGETMTAFAEVEIMKSESA